LDSKILASLSDIQKIEAQKLTDHPVHIGDSHVESEDSEPECEKVLCAGIETKQKVVY
jgi:hypothetical protein